MTATPARQLQPIDYGFEAEPQSIEDELFAEQLMHAVVMPAFRGKIQRIELLDIETDDEHLDGLTGTVTLGSLTAERSQLLHSLYALKSVRLHQVIDDMVEQNRLNQEMGPLHYAMTRSARGSPEYATAQRAYQEVEALLRAQSTIVDDYFDKRIDPLDREIDSVAHDVWDSFSGMLFSLVAGLCGVPYLREDG